MRKSMVHVARKRWPRAIWIEGNGRYASVSRCDPGTTVMLFKSRHEAEAAKHQIDETGCGGGCRGAGWHEIWDLHTGRRIIRTAKRVIELEVVDLWDGRQIWFPTHEDRREVEIELTHIEDLMHESGLFKMEDIRPVNEDRMRARWKLGRALDDKSLRHQGARTDLKTLSGLQTKFRDLLGRIGLDKSVAVEAQRIGALPPNELDKALAEAVEQERLTYFSGLLIRARPYWYQASRERRHKRIAASAKLVNPDFWASFLRTFPPAGSA